LDREFRGAGARLPHGRSAAQQLLHALDVGLGDIGIAAQAALTGGGLVLQQVAGVGLLAHELARAGDADALLGTRVGLVLRHLPVLLVTFLRTRSRSRSHSRNRTGRPYPGRRPSQHRSCACGPRPWPGPSSCEARRPSPCCGRPAAGAARRNRGPRPRSEEHTSELQSRFDIVCRLLLERKHRDAWPPRPDARAPVPACLRRAPLRLLSCCAPAPSRSCLSLRAALPLSAFSASVLRLRASARAWAFFL